MAKFKFRDNTLKLDIEDKTYEVDISNFEQSEKLLTIAKDAMKIGEQGNTEKTVETMIMMIEDAIDTILGNGATKDIFQDRKINLLDLLDLLAYITEEITEFRANKLEKVYSVNRKNELVD